MLIYYCTDKQYLLKKCPYLLNEMITILFHLFTLDQMERGTSSLLVSVYVSFSDFYFVINLHEQFKTYNY